jgi:hypothetical protein
MMPTCGDVGVQGFHVSAAAGQQGSDFALYTSDTCLGSHNKDGWVVPCGKHLYELLQTRRGGYPLCST